MTNQPIVRASTDDEPADRQSHERGPLGNRAAVVGQGVLALDGGQPDLFDDDEEAFQPVPILTASATIEPPRIDPLPPSEARNTVLHEIDHALVGHAAGHGVTRKAKAAEIGARPERCFDSATARVDGDWSGVCSAGHSRSRHRAPKHFTVSCSVCLPRQFDERYLLRWYWRGIPVLEPGTDVEMVGDHEWTGLGGRGMSSCSTSGAKHT